MMVTGLADILRKATEPVSLEDGKIDGPVDLKGLDVKVPVSLKNCTFEGPVDFSLAQVAGNLTLTNCTFKAGLSLEGTRIGHHLILDCCTFLAPQQGEAYFNTCRLDIMGDLYIINTKLSILWSGENMEVQGSLLAEGLKNIEGTRSANVMLHGLHAREVTFSDGHFASFFLCCARIGHHLHLSRTYFDEEAVFRNTQVGANLFCEGISTKGNLAFDSTDIKGRIFFGPDEKGTLCEIGGEASFKGVHISGDAGFEGVTFKQMVGFDGAEIKGSLYFHPDDKGNPCTAKGKVRLPGIHIGGQASFKGVTFKQGVAFDGAEVKSGLFFQSDNKGNPCMMEDEATFSGSHIDVLAKFEGVTFEKGVAFDGAELKGSILFQPDNQGNPSTIKGKAEFIGTHIGGQVNFIGVAFTNGIAFCMSDVKGGVAFLSDEKGNPCKIGGDVCFHNVHIGEAAIFCGVNFKNEVDFDGAEVNGDLSFLPNEKGNSCTIEGSISFHGASIGKILSFGGAQIKADLNLKNAKVCYLRTDGIQGVSGKLYLAGCEYNIVDNKERLLALLKEKGVKERQPYEFLERYCRDIGEAPFARDVYYEWKELVSPEWRESRLAFIWDRLLRWTVGYGIRPFRMVWWTLGLFALEFILIKSALLIKSLATEHYPGWLMTSWLSLKYLLPWEVEYYEDYNWELTLCGAIILTAIKSIVWFIIGVGSMAIGGLFRRHE